MLDGALGLQAFASKHDLGLHLQPGDKLTMNNKEKLCCKRVFNNLNPVHFVRRMAFQNEVESPS